MFFGGKEMSSVIRTILTVVLTIDCIALVAVIMMQKSKDPGLGAIGGMSGSMDTYWGKNKGRSMEGNLIRITRILGILFFVIALVLNINF